MPPGSSPAPAQPRVDSGAPAHGMTDGGPADARVAEYAVASAAGSCLPPCIMKLAMEAVDHPTHRGRIGDEQEPDPAARRHRVG